MNSKHLTIFEGPDGSGKTTAAKRYAEETDARYVHLGPFPRVRHGLARLYVEAMMPALLGYQDVVMDRCWISEAPYGLVHREGEMRLHTSDVRMLERIALRCGAVVVKCLPPLDVVSATYTRRKGQEMLTSIRALEAVYGLYCKSLTRLPWFAYDYTASVPWATIVKGVRQYRDLAHPINLQTVGSWDRANVVIVGDTFGQVKEHDTLTQWPFVSFSNDGCSRWLTERLEVFGVPERQLLWVNADQDLSFIRGLKQQPEVIGLGDIAQRQLSYHRIGRVHGIPHPQYWKRFHPNKEYTLMQVLERIFP